MSAIHFIFIGRNESAEVSALRLLSYMHELWRVRWSMRFFRSAGDAMSPAASSVEPIGLASYRRFRGELRKPSASTAPSSAAVAAAAPPVPPGALADYLSAVLDEIESSAGSLDDDDASEQDACCVSASSLIVVGPIAAATGGISRWSELSSKAYAKQRIGVFWCDTSSSGGGGDGRKLREAMARALRSSHGTVIPAELLVAADALLPLPIALSSCFAGLPTPAALAVRSGSSSSSVGGGGGGGALAVATAMRWVAPVAAPVVANGQKLSATLLAATSDRGTVVWSGRLQVGGGRNGRSCALELKSLVADESSTEGRRFSLLQQQQRAEAPSAHLLSEEPVRVTSSTAPSAVLRIARASTAATQQGVGALPGATATSALAIARMDVRGYISADDCTLSRGPHALLCRSSRVLVCVPCGVDGADGSGGDAALLLTDLIAMLRRRRLVAVVDFSLGGGVGGGRCATSALLSPASDCDGGVGVVRELALFSSAVLDAASAKEAPDIQLCEYTSLPPSMTTAATAAVVSDAAREAREAAAHNVPRSNAAHSAACLLEEWWGGGEELSSARGGGSAVTTTTSAAAVTTRRERSVAALPQTWIGDAQDATRIENLREKLDAKCVEERLRNDAALFGNTAIKEAARAGSSDAGGDHHKPPDAASVLATLNQRVSDALARVEEALRDATLRPEERVSLIFSSAITPTVRSISELLGQHGGADSGAACLRELLEPSESTAAPASSEDLARRVVRQFIASKGKPAGASEDATRLLGLQFDVFCAFGLEVPTNLEKVKKKQKQWLKTMVWKKLGKLGFEGDAFFQRFLGQLNDAFGSNLPGTLLMVYEYFEYDDDRLPVPLQVSIVYVCVCVCVLRACVKSILWSSLLRMHLDVSFFLFLFLFDRRRCSERNRRRRISGGTTRHDCAMLRVRAHAAAPSKSEHRAKRLQVKSRSSSRLTW